MPSNEPLPLRIMPLGDSITVGFTDNPTWAHPFEFGYRSGLYKRLSDAGHNFLFVGASEEPFDAKYGDPTHGGTVHPALELRALNQNGHRGYGGWSIAKLQRHVADWIASDQPDLILLQIGINGIGPESPKQLDALVETIFGAKEDVTLIVAQIMPRKEFNEDLLNFNTHIRQTLVPTHASKMHRIHTVDLHSLFLRDIEDPQSIYANCFSNGINHPTNALYDRMAERWFQKISENEQTQTL